MNTAIITSPHSSPLSRGPLCENQHNMIITKMEETHSMMEQTDSGEAHHHAVRIRRFDDIVIADRSAGFSHVFHTASCGAFDVVAFLSSQALFSSRVKTSGFTVKMFCHFPSARTSI